MDAELLTESKWMVAREFGFDGIAKEPTATIASVGREKQKPIAKGKRGEVWGIVHFVEQWAKPYKFNGTNKRALITMFGSETDRWIGKRITFYAKPGVYFGEQGVAVRIKGSPDLTEAKSFSVKRFGGGDDVYNLVPTGGSRAGAPTTPPPASGGAAVANTPPPGHPGATPAPQGEGGKVTNDPRTSKGEVVSTGPLEPRNTPPTASGKAGPAPEPSPPAAGPLIGFGPHKKRPLSELADPELLETIQVGESKIAADPKAPWRQPVEAEIAVIRGEVERRYAAKMAAADKPPSREPGSDDGDPGAAVPPF